MTLPSTYNIDDVYRGDDYSIPLAFFDDEAETIPSTLNATGWLSQVRVTPDASAPAATFTVDTSQAAAGILTLSLTGAVTQSLTDGYWDIQQTLAGKTRTWVRGKFIMEKDISRA